VKKEKKRRQSTIFLEMPSRFGDHVKLQSYKPRLSVGGIPNGAYQHNEQDEDDDIDEDGYKEAGEKSGNRVSICSSKDSKTSSDPSTPTTTPNDCQAGPDSKDDGKKDEGKTNDEKAGSGSGPRTVEHAKLNRSVLSKMESVNETSNSVLFRDKKAGTIDVWWLFDDGGWFSFCFRQDNIHSIQYTCSHDA
jgi:hypothetical protein